jgi:hypothetical protein
MCLVLPLDFSLVTKLPLGHAAGEAPASLVLGKLELPDCGSQAGAWEPEETVQRI